MGSYLIKTNDHSIKILLYYVHLYIYIPTHILAIGCNNNMAFIIFVALLLALENCDPSSINTLLPGNNIFSKDCLTKVYLC